MNSLLYIAVFLIIGMAIVAIPAAILARCSWHLTKSLPAWLRLQISLALATGLAALGCTPLGGGGQVAMLPLGLICVLDFPDLLFDLSGGDSRSKVLEQMCTFLGIWVVLYAISMVVVSIRQIKRKRCEAMRSPLDGEM